MTDHYPVEHWLFGSACIPADEKPPSIILSDTSKPVSHGYWSLQAVPASHLFRFEGVTLRGFSR